jgi:hypothetical protein
VTQGPLRNQCTCSASTRSSSPAPGQRAFAAVSLVKGLTGRPSRPGPRRPRPRRTARGTARRSPGRARSASGHLPRARPRLARAPDGHPAPAALRRHIFPLVLIAGAVFPVLPGSAGTRPPDQAASHPASLEPIRQAGSRGPGHSRLRGSTRRAWQERHSQSRTRRVPPGPAARPHARWTRPGSAALNAAALTQMSPGRQRTTSRSSECPLPRSRRSDRPLLQSQTELPAQRALFGTAAARRTGRSEHSHTQRTANHLARRFGDPAYGASALPSRSVGCAEYRLTRGIRRSARWLAAGGAACRGCRAG